MWLDHLGRKKKGLRESPGIAVIIDTMAQAEARKKENR